MDFKFNNIYAFISFLTFCFKLYFGEEPEVTEDLDENKVYIKNSASIGGTHIFISSDLHRFYTSVDCDDFINNTDEYSKENFIDLIRIICKGNGFHLITEHFDYDENEEVTNITVVYSKL